jgi:hypothetical protein
MSISHIGIKIKELGSLLARLADRRDVFALCAVFLAGTGGYLFGSLDPLSPVPKAVEIRVGERVSARTTPPATAATTTVPILVPAEKLAGKYAASKKGTKYYLPTCSGAKSISEANKIWFSTKEEAERAGYAPAATCKGI